LDCSVSELLNAGYELAEIDHKSGITKEYPEMEPRTLITSSIYLFKDDNINKIVTIEASGIGIACVAAQYFNVPVVFAKKGIHRNVGNDIYTGEVFSFTKGEKTQIGISRNYLTAEDRILIIDDFLANGGAVKGLIHIAEQAGAEVKGIGICIEKGFQPGGKALREMGYKLESLAIINSIDDGKIIFG
ncbi:MAG: xanthine phosphoribosyltransferase, partial [Clostridia bacterium]|nr:xanthine phosphoribosyltransferase [Clostridia bacterium]